MQLFKPSHTCAYIAGGALIAPGSTRLLVPSNTWACVAEGAVTSIAGGAVTSAAGLARVVPVTCSTCAYAFTHCEGVNSHIKILTLSSGWTCSQPTLHTAA